MANAYHYGDLREAMISEAMRALEEGHGAPGLRDIARRVGVSPTATYRHFASRDALLGAVAQRGFDDLGHRFAEAAKDRDRGLMGFGLAYVAFARERPAMFRLMFGGAIPVPSQISQDEGDGERIGSGAFRALLQAVALTRGSSTDDPDVLVAAVRAWSLVHGYAMLLLDDRLPDAAADRAFLNRMLDGSGSE